MGSSDAVQFGIRDRQSCQADRGRMRFAPTISPPSPPKWTVLWRARFSGLFRGQPEGSSSGGYRQELDFPRHPLNRLRPGHPPTGPPKTPSNPFRFPPPSPSPTPLPLPPGFRPAVAPSAPRSAAPGPAGCWRRGPGPSRRGKARGRRRCR